MREIAQIAARLYELERRNAGGLIHGTVAQVDPASGKVRLNLGAGETGDALSPWVQYMQIGGALKVHSPPSIGQQMSLMSPSGDMESGVALPMGFSDGNPSPGASGDTHVVTIGAVRAELSPSMVKIAIGGVTFLITSGGVDITGGSVKHNGKDIGSTHKHGGISIGIDSTAVPN